MSTREFRASQLKAAREKIGDVQEVFAAKLSVPLSTYRRYEQGVSDIPINIYAAMSESWGFDLTELITGKKSARTASGPDDDELSGAADKGLIHAVSEGAQLGDEANISRIRRGIYKAIRYALERDRRGLPL